VDVKFGKMVYEVSKPGNGGTVVHLTLVSHDDEETLRREGLAGLRRERILRLTREALRQQQVLGYEDLSQLLMTSVATGGAAREEKKAASRHGWKCRFE
jgi:hypothetical protein